jgi:hypothetical protein
MASMPLEAFVPSFGCVASDMLRSYGLPYRLQLVMEFDGAGRRNDPVVDTQV